MSSKNGDFTVSVKVNPDVSNVQKTLNQNQDRWRIRAQLDVDTQRVQNQINNLFRGTDLDGFDRINTKIQRNITGLDRYGNTVRGLIKYTETFKNEIGDVSERMTLLTRGGQVVGQSLQRVQNGLREIATDTQQFKQKIDGLNVTVTQVSKSWTDTAGQAKQVVEVTREWTDANGRLNKTVETLNQNGQQVAPTIRTVSDNIQKTSNSANKLGTSFGNAIAQLAKFYLASLPIRAITKAISEATESIKNFDAAITEMGKVTEYNGEQLRQYTKDLGNLGKEVARTRTEMTEAATGWLKAGYSEEDAAQLAKYSSLLQNTADEKLSAADATSILVSQLKAYHMETNEAIKVTDIINKVSAEQAVSSSDIAKGLTVASASMSTFGNSIEQTTALLTAGTTIFQGRSQQVARGLNMIATRVAKNADELKKYDVAVKDSSGNLRATYDILVDLAPKWEQMSNAEQVALGNTLAGTNQYKIFAAIMNQMSVAQESYRQALESSGTTMEQNEVYMNSLEAKTTALKAEFEKLVLGDGGLQDFAKKIVDLGTAILKFANSDVGQVIVKTTALILTLGLLNKGLVSLATGFVKVIASLAGLEAAEVSATIASEGLAVALRTASMAFLTSPFGVALLLLTSATAAAIASAKAMENYANRLKDANEQLNNTVEKIKDTESELDTLKTSLKSVSDQIEKNNQKKLEITNEHQIELLDIENEKLAEKTKELEIQIALKERELELAKQAAEEEAKTVLNTTTESQFKRQDVIDSFSGASTGETRGIQVVPEEELKLAIDRFTELKEKAKDLEVQLSKTPKGEEWDKLNNELESTKTEMGGVANRGAEMSEIITNALSNIDSMAQEDRDRLNALVDEYLKLDDASSAFRKHLKNKLDELGKGGKVNLNLRPVIDTEDLNKAGYEAGKGIATVFTQTFSNEAKNIAVNFTPIMVDPNTGEYLGVMEKSEFEQYCQDVVDGVREDDLNLQIGMKFEGEDAIQQAEDAAKEIHEIHETLAEDSEAYQEEFQEEIEETSEAASSSIDEIDNKLENLMQTLGMTQTELEGLRELFRDSFGDTDGSGLENYLNQLAEIRQSMSDTSTVIDNLQNALAVAQGAWDEYNQQGYLTIDTFQSLMSIQAQYLTALVNENGQLEINQTTIGNLIETLKQAKIEELQMAEATDIAAYAQGDLDKMSSLARNSLINVGNAAYTAGQNAQAGATGFWTLADAIASARKAAGDTDIASDINIQRIHNSYRKLAKQISEVKVNTTAAGGAAQKAGRAAKSAGSAAKQAGKDASDAAKDAKKAIEDEVKALEKKQKQYERVIKWIEKQYDKQIDKIKKEKEEAVKSIEAQIKAKEKQKDKELDAIEAQIKALDKEKDARKEYWDAQIDALKKANKESKDALELQEKLDALEKAKSTKVKIYKEGQGFVYDVDQTAVQEAQKALDEYLSEKAYEDELARLEALRDAELDNYEQRINALEDYKDKVQENYEKQIENLEAYKEQVEAHYDAQIEMYENYKQQFEDMVNAYEEEQDRLLASQLAGIDAENNNWMTRLDNLQNFVNEYHALLRQIEDAKARMDAVTNGASAGVGGGGGSSSGGGGGSVSSGGGGSSSSGRKTVTNQDYPNNQYTPNPEHKKESKFPTTATRGTPYHAKGIDTIPNDEIAIVGDAPNQELVIGSKLNGKIMSLNKGDGVVNAESSKTLAGMLNQIGKYGASGFGSGNGTLNNNVSNESLTINGVTIQGADIKDPQTFVNGLLNLKAEALQRAYAHR